MGFKKSELEAMKIKKLEPEKVVIAKDRTNEVLDAIKNIKLEPVEPVIVEHKISDEILVQQKAMMDKMSEAPLSPEFPSYHFEVNRSSDGFIKSVDATPQKTDGADDRNVAKIWYKDKE